MFEDTVYWMLVNMLPINVRERNSDQWALFDEIDITDLKKLN